MPEALTPRMEAFYVHADDRLHAGARGDAVRRELEAKGATPEEARMVVSQLGDQIRKKKRSNAMANMIMGTIWCAGGLGATYASYAFTAGLGGVYYSLYWGAILFGAVQGFYGYNKYAATSRRDA